MTAHAVLIVHSGHYSIHLSRIVCTVKKFCAAPILAFERNWGYTNIANDLTLIGIATNAVERKPRVSVLAIPLKRVMERFISYCLSYNRPSLVDFRSNLRTSSCLRIVNIRRRLAWRLSSRFHASCHPLLDGNASYMIPIMNHI